MSFLSKSNLKYHRCFFKIFRKTNTQLRLINSSRSAIISAIKILNLSDTSHFNPRQLRDAYFAEAKLCHPDSSPRRKDSGESAKVHKQNCASRFHKVNEAYDLLLKQKVTSTSVSSAEDNGYDDDLFYDNDISHIISKSEEQWFREACRDTLGVDAETVEESKKCPVFLDWLKGRSMMARHWTFFFMQNGGLAPMLKNRQTLRIADKNTRRRRKK